jgi:hypothetical protein
MVRYQKDSVGGAGKWNALCGIAARINRCSSPATGGFLPTRLCVQAAVFPIADGSRVQLHHCNVAQHAFAKRVSASVGNARRVRELTR